MAESSRPARGGEGSARGARAAEGARGQRSARPRRIVFVDELPVSPSGKIVKRQLVAQYARQ